MRITLNTAEIALLDLQDSSTQSKGGFQSFLVKLKERVDRTTGELELEPKDLKKIPRYAFEYGQGGWEERLKGIFGRTLGADLGRQTSSN